MTHLVFNSDLYLNIDVTCKFKTDTSYNSINNLIDRFSHGYVTNISEVYISDDMLIDPTLTLFSKNNLKRLPLKQIHHHCTDVNTWKLLYNLKLISSDTMMAQFTYFFSYKRDNWKIYNDKTNNIYLFDLYNELLVDLDLDDDIIINIMDVLLKFGMETIAYDVYKRKPKLTTEQKIKCIAIMNQRINQNTKILYPEFISDELYNELIINIDVNSRFELQNKTNNMLNIDLHHDKILGTLNSDDIKRIDRLYGGINNSINIIGTYIMTIANNITTNEYATDDDVKFIDSLIENNMYKRVVRYEKI